MYENTSTIPNNFEVHLLPFIQLTVLSTFSCCLCTSSGLSVCKKMILTKLVYSDNTQTWAFIEYEACLKLICFTWYCAKDALRFCSSVDRCQGASKTAPDVSSIGCMVTHYSHDGHVCQCLTSTWNRDKKALCKFVHIPEKHFVWFNDLVKIPKTTQPSFNRT